MSLETANNTVSVGLRKDLKMKSPGFRVALTPWPSLYIRQGRSMAGRQGGGRAEGGRGGGRRQRSHLTLTVSPAMSMYRLMASFSYTKQEP